MLKDIDLYIHGLIRYAYSYNTTAKYNNMPIYTYNTNYIYIYKKNNYTSIKSIIYSFICKFGHNHIA